MPPERIPGHSPDTTVGHADGRPGRSRLRASILAGPVKALVILGIAFGLLAPARAAEAQQRAKVPRIGYLSPGPGPSVFDEAFRQGLRELGYAEGQNIAIDYRWAGWKGTGLLPGGRDAPVSARPHRLHRVRFYGPNLAQGVALTHKHRLQAIYAWKLDVGAGGPMPHATSIPDFHHRSEVHVDKILKSAKAADLPVEQPTRFELVVNLKTTKALSLTIPQSILIRADQVIQ